MLRATTNEENGLPLGEWPMLSTYAEIRETGGDRIPLLERLPGLTRRLLPETGGQLSEQDARAFTDQWMRCQLSVRAYFTSYLSDRSAIDDCIQEVAIVAWKKGPRDEGADAFLAYCLACARRIAKGEVRKKYRHPQVSLSPDVLSSLAETVAHMEQEETMEPAARISALQSCLDSLKSAPRRLLELRYTSREPAALQREAEATGTSRDALYKKLERLRALLRDCVLRKSALSE
ncbi:sigma-70 family RNA polymerase sigma factor [Luteolibacter ambystomatis]|uniref:Sigma-70 family RNA polymerase sigma factor n=1 Tax=Luteolibacter ambystomatis TaxID=2824561 RepID=A0A975G6W1_9BACT|nr:sigma-70 family RNA polymerase sigma factor [Luteolibacter ambystomatis]QUE49375.1 sigma-70 family RNA polymerase sigma factor [Luteolibacter ambystomatis]